MLPAFIDISIATWPLMAFRLIGAASLGIWIYLLLARGRFWQLRFLELSPVDKDSSQPALAAIIPARDEVDVVGDSISSLLLQNYRGPLQVFLVDDASSDGTANVARTAAAKFGKQDRLTIISATPLPAGWTGKLWALSQGIRAATASGAEYFLLTDADIVHGPKEVAALVSHAQANNLDMVSLMARLSCESLPERFVIPAFVYFFFMLYPPAWVARASHNTAAAAGGCILIRRAALERIGGIAAIRSELIDDCALAREVKRGGSIWLGPVAETRSIRSYASWGELDDMISRTAFTQLDHSFWILLGTIFAMSATYLVPPLLPAMGFITKDLWAAGLGASAWALMSLSFWPMLRYYYRSPIWAPLLPLIAVFYLGATIHSAVLYWQGRGGNWKGRVQDPARSKASGADPSAEKL